VPLHQCHALKCPFWTTRCAAGASDMPAHTIYNIHTTSAHLGCNPAHAAVSGPVHVQDGLHIAEGECSGMAVPAPTPATWQPPCVPDAPCALMRLCFCMCSDRAVALSNHVDAPVALVKHTSEVKQSGATLGMCSQKIWNLILSAVTAMHAHPALGPGRKVCSVSPRRTAALPSARQ
jgi:hypothetical protein